MVELSKEKIIDKKIGTIDIETFSINESGEQAVYSAGWAVKNKTQLYYLDDKNCQNSHQLLITMFNDILHSEYHDYTFYVHNLAGFDSVLILDSLTRVDDIKLKMIMKDDNTLVSLKISKNIKDSKWTISRKELEFRFYNPQREYVVQSNKIRLENVFQS